MSNKKQIFKIDTLKKLLNDENSCITLVPTTRLLALPPFFLNDMKSGILYLLNNLLKKYDRTLGGIIIGYQNIKVLMDENTGIIPMGTSETEVNIFVEFYVFQPKIGSFLEGVVNKKSNSHIGCLVHRYFNATILKPEDVDYNNWICQDFNVDDKIIFKVKDLDFTSFLPLIEGAIDDEIFLKKSKSNFNENYHLSNNIVNNVNETYSEVLFTKEFSDNKKEIINDKELTSAILNKNFNINEKYRTKKKKKKNKKEQENEEMKCTQESLNVTMDLTKCLFPKEADDEIFYSTQLLSTSPGKMKTCCSPISKSIPFEQNSQNLESKNQNEINENEKRKKCKKRKREQQEPEGLSAPKKVKTFCSLLTEKESSKDKTNIDEGKSSVQIIMEELCRKQLNRIKKDLNRSDKETSKVRKNKMEKLNKEREKMPNLIKDKKCQVNGKSETEQNSGVHDVLDELRELEMQKVKKELSISSRKSCKEIKKIKTKMKEEEKEIVREKGRENLFGLKKSTKLLNGIGNGAKDFSVQDMMDQLLKQELNRVKLDHQKSDAKSAKEWKKPKKVIKKREKTLTEEPQNFLYEKLLKAAKTSVDLEKEKSSSLPLSKESEKKKKKDFSNLKNFIQLRGSVENPDLNFQNTKKNGEVYEKYKNGSMYDAALTPEKVNFEKSLFSDSEQSHSSPTKREKKMSEIEIKFNEQNPLNIEMEVVKNRSGKKKERRSCKSEKEQDHLYEKLMKEAKSLIESRNEFSSRKKNKSI